MSMQVSLRPMSRLFLMCRRSRCLIRQQWEYLHKKLEMTSVSWYSRNSADSVYIGMERRQECVQSSVWLINSWYEWTLPKVNNNRRWRRRPSTIERPKQRENPAPVSAIVWEVMWQWRQMDSSHRSFSHRVLEQSWLCNELECRWL